MASEIRVNKIENRSGLGTVTFADTGVDLAGIVTATTFSGSGASLTNIPDSALSAVTASKLTGALPAISGANLTGIAATDNVRTGILDVAGISTFRNTVNIGAAVTISESGIEASGIGITCANINGGQIGGRRNVIINGDMQIWQRSTSASDIGGSNGYFACDRYRSSNNGSQRHTISRSTDTPNGFGYSMKIDVTTANASPSAANYVFIQHRLEGHDVQQFAKGSSDAKQYTLSFYVKSPKTGVHVVQWEDVQNSRSTSKSYTVSQANTWEKHTITFDADTTGAISNDSSHRMQLYFWLMAGSTYNSGSLATTWGSTGTSNRAAGQVNVFDNTSNDFYITGIQLEVGPQATAFEHRSFAEELILCQRYYQRYREGNNISLGLGFGYAADELDIPISFIVPMRSSPSLEQSVSTSGYAQIEGSGIGGSQFVNANFTLQFGSTNGCNLYVDPAATLTSGSPYHLILRNASAYIAFTSEL